MATGAEEAGKVGVLAVFLSQKGRCDVCLRFSVDALFQNTKGERSVSLVSVFLPYLKYV